MALINCPECGKQISDKAASCPHCGYPIVATYRKEETIKIESFTVAFRGGPGSVGVFTVLGFILSLIGLIGGILALTMTTYLYIQGTLLVIFGAILFIIGLVNFFYFYKNQKLIRYNCIEYDASKNKLLLFTLSGKKIEIDPKDYVTHVDNFFTDNMLKFTYKTRNGALRKVKLGYCSNRDNIRANIEKVRRHNDVRL